jgi:hypothetical protein
MDPGLVLEKNLTVVSVVAFNVLQAAVAMPTLASATTHMNLTFENAGLLMTDPPFPIEDT